MATKEQILKTKNAKGGNMKAYTLGEYAGGKLVRGSDFWVTLSDLLGLTDFSDAEVDSLADLEVGETLTLDAGENGDVIPEEGAYMLVTRVH